MITKVTYGQISIKMEADSEGHAFSCPLCSQLFFCNGGIDHCIKTGREHLQQFHRMSHLPTETTELSSKETCKITLKAPQKTPVSFQ